MQKEIEDNARRIEKLLDSYSASPVISARTNPGTRGLRAGPAAQLRPHRPQAGAGRARKNGAIRRLGVGGKLMTMKCVSCGKATTVSCTPAQLSAWRGGQLIQDAMPNVPRAEREMLLSGLCGECFREMCAEQDTDY